jgi:hypothetical protein
MRTVIGPPGVRSGLKTIGLAQPLATPLIKKGYDAP